MRNATRILKYLRPYRRLAVASACLMLTSVLFGLLTPWPLMILVDCVLGNQPLPAFVAPLIEWLGANQIQLLALTVAAGLAITFLEHGLTVLNSYADAKLEQNMILDLRSDLFQHAERLSLAFHDQRRSGMLIYAINGQADAAAGLVMAIPPLVQSALTLVGMFWISMHIHWQLAVLSLVVVPLLFASTRYYVRHIQDRLENAKALEGESLSIVHEAISMLRVIVAFGREDHEHRRFRRQGREAVDARVKVTVRQTAFSLAVNTITAIGTALVLGFGAYHVLHQRLTIGQLLVVMSYIAAVYKPLEAISYTIGSLQDRIVSLRMACRLLDTPPEIVDEPDAIDLPRVAGRVTFDRVGFSYRGRVDTLRGISFDVQPGQVVAVVGPTGAGKTTLVSLIPRFYAPQSGQILVDGVDIRRIKLSDLRRHISLVLQEPLLFSGTVADNIRYGRLDASDDDVIAAAVAAHAHDFIMRLPNQYQTTLGERGIQLSGGERQRLCIARAFLRNAPILILDEPTSSIDVKTEAVILDALERLMAGRTTFLIAHRLSTIRQADHILVLDRGRLVEQGSRDELLARDGLFRQLWDTSQQPVLSRAASVVADWSPDADELSTEDER